MSLNRKHHHYQQAEKRHLRIEKSKHESFNRQRAISIVFILLLLIGGSLAFLYYYLSPQKLLLKDPIKKPGDKSNTRHTLKNSENKSDACQQHFIKRVYHQGKSAGVNTTMIGVKHREYEEFAADCLTYLAKDGDHLIIETTDQNKEIPCGSVHAAFKKFDNKLHCYGFDVEMDKAREMYHDYLLRGSFLERNVNDLFAVAVSASDYREKLTNLAKHIGDKIAPNEKFEAANKRMSKYLAQLAERMDGKSMDEMRAYLITEKEYLNSQQEHYALLSRRGPTDEALMRKINAHRNQLTGSKQNLFVVAGADHFDVMRNKFLKEEMETTNDDVIAFMPNTGRYHPKQ